MPFPNQIQTTQAPGVEGDFASANPRHSKLSVPGGFIAGAAGLTIGRFAWADTATGTVLLNSGTGAPSCFIHRALQAMITTYLGENGMLIPGGQGVGEMFDAGDFWVRNTGAGAVTVGQKVFASNTTGAASTAAAGGTVSGSTETRFYAHTAAAAGELFKMSHIAPA